MKYEILGDSLPVVICNLNNGERVISEAGAMGWMSSNIDMDTNMKGGLLGGLGRAFSGESVFLNKFTSNSDGETIAFPSSLPGNIIAKELKEGESFLCQKGSFLAATEGVDLKIDFRKRLGTGMFGGEGFILQRISGPGLCFLEIDGYSHEINLKAGEEIKVDTGNIAMFDDSVEYSIKMVKGLKNMFFGGEGLFLSTLRGPGKVILQSMPVQNLAGQLARYFNFNKDK